MQEKVSNMGVRCGKKHRSLLINVSHHSVSVMTPTVTFVTQFYSAHDRYNLSIFASALLRLHWDEQSLREPKVQSHL